MVRLFAFLCATILIVTPSVRAAEILNFNNDWAYEIGDIPNGERVGLDDSAWAAVTIPHTLAMEKKYLGRCNYKGLGWYRRYFMLDPALQGKHIDVVFAGVMIDCDVYLNGQKLATHNGGYLGFSVDISDKAKFGQSNLLAVRVSNLDDPETPPGKPETHLDFHYFGGIYRDVSMRVHDRLRITDPLQAEQVAGGGVFVTYPTVSPERALIHVNTQIANDRAEAASFSLKTTLLDAAGDSVAETSTAPATLNSGQNVQLQQDITVNNPKLWHPDHPNLYTLVSEVVEAGKSVDSLKTRIGIRRIEFKPDGFYINGEKLFINGGNRHQQFQNIGDAAPDSMQRWDAQGLKDDGFNAVRGHYPNAPAFLDACDELGILVIESQPGWQFWNSSKMFWDATLRDARQMIRRDRNRPSVVLWETTLNETALPDAWKKADTDAAHQEYPGDQMFVSQDGVSPYYNVGYKVVYKGNGWQDHDPQKPFVTREWGDWEGNSTSLRASGQEAMIRQVIYRQVYLNGDGYDDWGGLDSCDRIAGIFLWSWMDYTRGSGDDTKACGAVDINRYPKFCHYWLRSMTNSRSPAWGPMVFIADYNQAKGPVTQSTFSSSYQHRPGKWVVPWSNANVMVFSNCDSVRLYQNGSLLQEITRAHNGGTAPNIVGKGGSPYFVFKRQSLQPGTLLAEGIMDGKVVAKNEVKTPEAPVRLVIDPATTESPLIADGSDLLPVYIKVVDSNGTMVPVANNTIRVTVQGEGELVGKGIARLEVEQQKVEAGLGFAFVRSTGKAGRIIIRCTSAGLADGELELSTVPATCRFVPSASHAAWSNDEHVFEPVIVANEAAAKEIAVQGTPVAANVIQSITASCPALAGRGTDRLLDGQTDFGTGWLADSQALPQSVTFAFARPQTLTAAQVYWEKDSTWYQYDVETSSDGQKWNRVITARTITGQDSSPVRFKTAQQDVRFARLTLKDVKTGTSTIVIGIAEVRFFTK